MWLPFWFGRPFWLYFLLWVLLLPAVEVLVLSQWNIPRVVACLLAILDLIAAVFLFALAWGLSSFGTHALTIPVNLIEFLRRVCPREYSIIRYIAEQSEADIAQSQKDSFIQELINSPFSLKIFGRYIWRLASVVLTIPLYVGLAMIAISAVPEAHQLSGRGGAVGVVQSLGVIRDLQMGMLGGSSTEHLPYVVEETPLGQESGGTLEITEGAASLQVNESLGMRGPGGRTPRPRSSWGAVAWEVVGALCAFLYLSLALIMLPMQIGVVGTLERQLKSRSFWKRQLRSL
jgi:hypothetical protein